MKTGRSLSLTPPQTTGQRGGFATHGAGWWVALVAITLSAGSAAAALESEMVEIPIDGDGAPRATSPAPMHARPEAMASTPAVGSAVNSWFGGPTVNLRVTPLSSHQQSPSQVTDGAGGSIVVWQDFRNVATGGGVALYAHHVLACGVLDPTWPADGAVVKNNVSPANLTLVPDGAGGVIAAWEQPGLGGNDIYAQRLLSTGVPAPGWGAAGLPVCTAPNRQRLAKIASDGSGGAFVTWDDSRTGTATADRRVFVQHLLATGVDAAWPVNGRRACPDIEAGQTLPVICSDGAGGAIVAWNDLRFSADMDIFAQRMSATGALLWPAIGQPASLAPGRQVLNGASPGFIYGDMCSEVHSNAIVPDGASGCFVAWSDERDFAISDQDAYGQHLTASGSVAAGWNPNGVPLCVAPGSQNGPKVLSDRSGGTFATWVDARPMVLVQHVSVAGTVDGPPDGLPMSTLAGSGAALGVADGSGGAVFAFDQPAIVVAHHVFGAPAFTVDPAWPVNGATVTSAPGPKTALFGAGTVVTDGSGGAIVAWYDGRNSPPPPGILYDVYAQRILASGVLPDAGPDCDFDTEPPLIVCPADVVQCLGFDVTLGTATATDNVAVTTLTQNAPASFPLGMTVVTWTARDAAGNSATCQQRVTIQDCQPPLIYCQGDVVECSSANVRLQIQWASDNVGITELTNDAPATFPYGTTVVTWTARDAAGNVSTCQQRVTIRDCEPPVIGCPADIVECSGLNVALGTATASDNVGVTALTHDAPAIFPAGTTVVTWTARDAAGNAATCQQRVTILNCPMYNTLTQGFFGNPTGKFCGNRSGTADLILSLLNTDLMVGKSRTASFKLRKASSADAACFMAMLPGGGSSAPLPRGDGRFTSSCGTTTDIPLVDGKFSILLAQTLTLGLDLRLPNSSLGSLRLAGAYMTVQDAADGPDGICVTGDDIAVSGSSETLRIPPPVLNRLGASNTVLDLYNLANTGLAGLDTGVLGSAPLDSIAQAIKAVVNGFDKGRYLVGFSASPGPPALARSEAPAPEPAPGNAEGPALPANGRLAIRIAPNPVAGATRILIDVAEVVDAPVNVGVYDVAGRRLRTLADQVMPGGRHEITWDGTDDRDTRLKQGMYFVRVTVGGVTTTRGLVLLQR